MDKGQGIRALVLDAASPEHARLRRLLDGAGQRGVDAGMAGVLEMLAHRAPGELVVIQARAAPRAAVRETLCVPVRDGVVQVPVGEVRYFLAEHKYVWLRTAHERLLIRDSLRALAHEFADTFLRVHRNALVAVRHVVGLEAADGRCRVRLTGIDDTLPVSRRRRAAVRRLVRDGGADCMTATIPVDGSEGVPGGW